MDGPAESDAARRDRAIFDLETRALEADVYASERAEIRTLTQTMMSQLPLMVALMSALATGGPVAIGAVTVIVPLEYFLFKRLGEAGKEIARRKALLEQHATGGSLSSGDAK